MNDPAHAEARRRIALVLVDADLMLGDDPRADATCELIRRAVADRAGINTLVDLFVREQLVEVGDDWCREIAARVLRAVRGQSRQMRTTDTPEEGS